MSILVDHPPAVYAECSASQQRVIDAAIEEAIEKTRQAINGVSKDAPLLHNWFGFSNPYAVKEVYVNILMSLVSVPLFITCDSEDSVYARAKPNSPFEIRIGQRFWQDNLSIVDTRSGVLIHELSHFNVNGGTDDFAYGAVQSQILAMFFQDLAARNADNYEYFAEYNYRSDSN